jgi:hypothetical protein
MYIKVTKWSSCSNEDFLAYYNDNGGDSNRVKDVSSDILRP